MIERKCWAENHRVEHSAQLPDIMGVSGRAMLDALIAGRADPQTMAALAKRRMRRKIPLLEQALTGLGRDHHRRLRAIQLVVYDLLREFSDPPPTSGSLFRSLSPGHH